jgi:hypothetical protein
MTRHGYPLPRSNGLILVKGPRSIAPNMACAVEPRQPVRQSKEQVRLAMNDRDAFQVALQGFASGQAGAEMPIVRPIAFVILLLAPLSAASAQATFEAKAICRAAMATITGRDLKLFQAANDPDGTIALTYTRPLDNFVWAYHCRLEGDRVIWADEPGRWRQDARDDKISFEIMGGGAQLRITRTPVNGSAAQELYDRDKFLER